MALYWQYDCRGARNTGVGGARLRRLVGRGLGDTTVDSCTPGNLRIRNGRAIRGVIANIATDRTLLSRTIHLNTSTIVIRRNCF